MVRTDAVWIPPSKSTLAMDRFARIGAGVAPEDAVDLHPGRMAPTMALGFLLVGLALPVDPTQTRGGEPCTR